MCFAYFQAQAAEPQPVPEVPTEAHVDDGKLARLKNAWAYLSGDPSAIVSETEVDLQERRDAMKAQEIELEEREDAVASAEAEIQIMRDNLRERGEAIADVKTRLTACVLEAVGKKEGTDVQ